jgi:hypothetical protein
MHEVSERRAGHLPGERATVDLRAGPVIRAIQRAAPGHRTLLPLRTAVAWKDSVLRPVPADQEPGNRSPADGGVQKVACYEKSRRKPLRTLNGNRPFSAAHVYQTKGTIFRNIRLLEARATDGALGLKGEAVRRPSELLTTKGSR